jgi:hypothetical protein
MARTLAAQRFVTLLTWMLLPSLIPDDDSLLWIWLP